MTRKLALGILIISIVALAFAFFVPVVQTSAAAGAHVYCPPLPVMCDSIIPLNAHHYDSLSMAVFGIGAASAGIFGSGFYYSVYS
jgi:hypothetical protein